MLELGLEGGGRGKGGGGEGKAFLVAGTANARSLEHGGRQKALELQVVGGEVGDVGRWVMSGGGARAGVLLRESWGPLRRIKGTLNDAVRLAFLKDPL